MLVSNTKYEILTPTGFQYFDGIVKNQKDTLKICFDDHSEIVVTHNHIFIDNDIEYEAKSLYIGQVLSNKQILNIFENGISNVYDPINVKNGNVYITEHLVSHNCSFLGSSLTLIPPEILSKLSPSPTVYTRDNLDIYENPIPGHSYVLTADPSKGVGGDFHTIQVIDISEIPYKQVAKYKDNIISPLLFPNIIYKLGKDYNNAHVLVEINISEQVAHILHHELEYENLLIINKKPKGLDKGQTAGGGFGGKPFLGINTDKKTKRIGCANLKSLMVENKLIIHDADTIAELSTFIEVKDSYAADDGYHDDLVMGLVMFSWLTTQAFFKELNNVELRKIMYENQMRFIEEELTPFGFYDDGNEEINDSPIMLLNF